MWCFICVSIQCLQYGWCVLGALNFGDGTSAGVLLTEHLPQKDWRSRIYPRAITSQSQASRPTRASRRLHIRPLNVHNIMLLAEATRRILSTSFVFEGPRRPNLLLYLFRNGPISEARASSLFAWKLRNALVPPGLRNEQETCSCSCTLMSEPVTFVLVLKARG